MNLKEFRVRNYRSVNDSGWIEVGKRTALVGRNESGKTSLLTALESLNPPEGTRDLSFVFDFPRDRESTDFNESLRVLDTHWLLTEDEQEELQRRFPRAKGVTQVTISRAYRPTCYVSFNSLPAFDLDMVHLKQRFGRLRQDILGAAKSATGAGEDGLDVSYIEDRLAGLRKQLLGLDAQRPSATLIDEVLAEVEQLVDDSGLSMGSAGDKAVDYLRTLAESIRDDQRDMLDSMEWVVDRIPLLVYLNDVPDVEGHHNLADYLYRREQGRPSESDLNFERLAKVAGFDPMALASQDAEDRQCRQQLVHRAGATLTRKLRSVWSDRPIKIRFNLDGDHFDTLVSDPTSIYDMEVNLNERSRGFQWFFSLYVLLAANPAQDISDNMILLLDEPGLHLHALGQRDLLEHLGVGLEQQVIYVTHSPFMIPVEDLSHVRTVNYNSEDGTTCSHRPRGDARTLYPIQVAMAYAADDGLFGDQALVLVAELSDYLYLGAMCGFFASSGRRVMLDDTEIVPMGGLDRAVYMLSSFGDETDGIVLLVNDWEPRWKRLKALTAEAEPVMEISSVFPKLRPAKPELNPEAGAGLDDLIDTEVYHDLVTTVYRKDLGRKRIEAADGSLPVVQHYRQVFEPLGVRFEPTRVAALFMGRATSDPDTVISQKTRNRFRKLFDEIDERLGA